MTMQNAKSFAAILAVIFTITSISFSSQASQPEKEWTMLVFLNGHNNLDSFGKKDINEMEKIGSTDQVNVVVQWASLNNKKTRRLLVQKDNDTMNVTSPTAQELPQVDMGDYKNLVDFVRWGHENYPAKHYFVVVWNHGSGWHSFLSNPDQYRDISNDDVTGNKITTLQLGVAMSDIAAIIGRRIDIYGSDACLMGMMEVAHQMKDSVEYFIGSEDLEPGDGWPYDKLLERWNALKPATAKDVSVILPEVFAASYTNGSQGNDAVTLSSFDLKETDALTTALSNLRVSLVSQETQEKGAVLSAIAASQKFYYSDYVDLGDFLVNLKSRMADQPGVQSYITDVETTLKRMIVANQATGNFKKAQGLALWLPSTKVTYDKHQKNYRELSFDIAAQWHLLLLDIL